MSQQPADWQDQPGLGEQLRALPRDAAREMGQGLLADLALLVVGGLWWLLCLGVAGGIGYLLADGLGLLVGLIVGVVIALAGWGIAVAAGFTGLLKTWRGTRRS